MQEHGRACTVVKRKLDLDVRERIATITLGHVVSKDCTHDLGILDGCASSNLPTELSINPIGNTHFIDGCVSRIPVVDFAGL